MSTATAPVTPATPAAQDQAPEEGAGDSSATQAQRIEAFAFILWRSVEGNKESFETSAARWRADATLRAEMRTAANGFLKDAEDSAGLKLMVGRRQRLEKFVSAVVTEPAKAAYQIGE